MDAGRRTAGVQESSETGLNAIDSIDGLVDYSADWTTVVSCNVISVQQSFDRFARWCAGEPACALHGQDVYGAYDVAAAAEPVVHKLAAPLLAAGSDPNVGWPLIAQLLAEVRTGGSSPVGQKRRHISDAATMADVRTNEHKPVRIHLSVTYGYLPSRPRSPEVSVAAIKAH